MAPSLPLGCTEVKSALQQRGKLAPGRGQGINVMLGFPPHPKQCKGREGSDGGQERIWPIDELLGIFPDNVIFSEDEQRSVDGETVLPDWNRVVQSHSPRPLRFRLLVGCRRPRGRHRGPLPVPALVRVSIARPWPADHRLPEASHPEV